MFHLHPQKTAPTCFSCVGLSGLIPNGKKVCDLAATRCSLRCIKSAACHAHRFASERATQLLQTLVLEGLVSPALICPCIASLFVERPSALDSAGMDPSPFLRKAWSATEHAGTLQLVSILQRREFDLTSIHLLRNELPGYRLVTVVFQGHLYVCVRSRIGNCTQPLHRHGVNMTRSEVVVSNAPSLWQRVKRNKLYTHFEHDMS